MNIEVSFNAGTSIIQACHDAKELAVKLNLEYVIFKFNDVKVNVSQKADIGKLSDDYMSINSQESKYKFILD